MNEMDKEQKIAEMLGIAFPKMPMRLVFLC